MGIGLFYADRLRAMYAGGRANATARRFARGWALVFRLGVLPRRWVTLEVTGRRSGRPRQFPLGMADWQGRWYLVPMLGGQCDWVRNVRAAGGRAVLRRRRAVECRLEELPAVFLVVPQGHQPDRPSRRAAGPGGSCRAWRGGRPSSCWPAGRSRNSSRRPRAEGPGQAG